MDTPQKLLLSVNEVAAMLSLSPQSVYDLVERGELPRIPKSITSRVLIPRKAIDDFIDRAQRNE